MFEVARRKKRDEWTNGQTSFVFLLDVTIIAMPLQYRSTTLYKEV